MCGRNRNSELLTLAFDGLFVVELCNSYQYGKETPRYAEEAIQIISDARKALMIAYNDKEVIHVFDRREHFDRYDDIMFLKQVCDDLKWKTWKKDLEQWLENIETVRTFFSALNSWALGSIHHGCF